MSFLVPQRYIRLRDPQGLERDIKRAEEVVAATPPGRSNRVATFRELASLGTVTYFEIHTASPISESNYIFRISYGA